MSFSANGTEAEDIALTTAAFFSANESEANRLIVCRRMRDGQDGYMVVTPLERKDGSTILVNRGWISKKHRDQRSRPQGLPAGEVTVEGLLREPWKKNMFTPDNRPDKGEFYFPDVKQMAELTGAQPVWVEATMGTLGLYGLPRLWYKGSCADFSM